MNWSFIVISFFLSFISWFCFLIIINEQSDNTASYASTIFEKEMLLTTAESSHYSVAEIAGRFQVDPRVGLKWQEANSRTKIIGYNELPAVEEDPPWKKYIEQFKNPLILLLLGEFEKW